MIVVVVCVLIDQPEEKVYLIEKFGLDERTPSYFAFKIKRHRISAR